MKKGSAVEVGVDAAPGSNPNSNSYWGSNFNSHSHSQWGGRGGNGAQLTHTRKYFGRKLLPQSMCSTHTPLLILSQYCTNCSVIAYTPHTTHYMSLKTNKYMGTVLSERAKNGPFFWKPNFTKGMPLTNGMQKQTLVLTNHSPFFWTNCSCLLFFMNKSFMFALFSEQIIHVCPFFRTNHLCLEWHTIFWKKIAKFCPAME